MNEILIIFAKAKTCIYVDIWLSHKFQITVEGDGYDENKSPHSSYERFEGVTVGRMALVRSVRIGKCFSLSSHSLPAESMTKFVIL